MNHRTILSQIAAGVTAEWLCDDLTMVDMSLLDCINLANCAAERARQYAGSPDGRFAREYESAKAWTWAASQYLVAL